MQTEHSDSFDCRATAAVLRSGAVVALAGHVAALISLLPLGKGSRLAFASVLVWSLVVYLSIRVNIDARFFELLAEHSSEQLDRWLDTTSLRKGAAPRPIAERRKGALRLWRGLIAMVVIQIALLLFALLRMLA